MFCGFCNSLKTSDADISALESFYKSTNGANWDLVSMGSPLRSDPAHYALHGMNASNFKGIAWNFTRDGGMLYVNDPCDAPSSSSGHWIGLMCECSSSSCNIIKMSMETGKLSGKIAPELESLTSLTALDLTGNLLTGHMPECLCNLTLLTYLALQGNRLQGPLSTRIGDLQKLTFLTLADNILDFMIPSSISTLTAVTYLDLSNNHFNGIIPKSIGNMSSLEQLYLDANYLNGNIPTSIGDLANLTHLYLASNGFNGQIPTSIGNLAHNLLQLTLFNNSLSGQIPTSLGDCTALTALGLQQNRLSGALPSSLSALTNLQILYMQDNSLTSSIPSFLGTFTGLRYLVLHDNLFRGPIPQTLSGLNNLVELLLQSNFLTGPIPSGIGNMSSLGILNLEYNQLSGVVPWQLRNLRKLNALQLSHNRLVSDPASPGFAFIDPSAQTTLSTLALGYNLFSGVIDSRIFTMKSLITIVLASNCFEGSLPSNVCNVTEVETLVLSDLSGGTCHQTYLWKDTAFGGTFNGHYIDNLVEGSVPECIFNGLSNLQVLVLSGNRFEGQLPADLTPSITFMDVSLNLMTGELPAAVARPNMQFFDASHNSFNGTLSIFGGVDASATPNKVLRLGVNRLSGDVPSSLKNLENINILTGNVFGCSTPSELPVNDPNDLQYQCGSNAYNTSLSTFSASVFVAFVLLLCTYCWSLSYTAEIREWTKPFYQTEQATLVSRELEMCPSLVRYGREMGHLRGFVLKMGLCILLVFTVVYISFGHEYRTVNHVYGWMTTAALMVGTAPTVTLLVMWLLFMVFMRYMVSSDNSSSSSSSSSSSNNTESKTTIDTAESESESKVVVVGSMDDRSDAVNVDITDRFLIPLLRLFIIFVVKMGVSICANAGFLYVLFHYDEVVQTLATTALGAFNFLFTFFFKWLFTAPILYFGVSREVHSNFLSNVAGSEIYFLFVASSLSTFWILLLTASAVEESCLNPLFISAPIVKTHYDVRQCVDFNVNGTCRTFGEKATTITIDSPYLYNYTCSSTLLRKYIPVFIAQYLVMMGVCVFQFYYLAWYTKNQRQAEEDTSYYGQLLLFAKETFMESTLLESNGQRESIHMNDLAASKVLGKHQKYRMNTTRSTTQKFESLLTASAFVFTDHMSALLVLFTFGVFAPLLALVITLSVYVKLYINEIVLGRCISIEASIVSMHKKRIARSSEEYVVKLAEGTRLRLYPDFASEKLRIVAHGESLIVDTSNAEKPSDNASGLVYVKVVGEPGWVPLNAINFKCENGEENMSLGRSSTTTREQQSAYSKRRLGLLATYKPVNADGTFVRKGPSFRASRLSTLYSGNNIELDLSEQIGAENATFVKLHSAPGWVALEAMEIVSVNRTDSRPAKVTHYPLNLHLWLGGQTIDSVETMIRNADSPWGAASVIRTLEQECSQFPHSVVSLGQRTFLIAFALSAAFVLNDIYNGITDLPNSYLAPIIITSAVPAFDIIPYLWSKVQEYRAGSSTIEAGTGDVELGAVESNDQNDGPESKPVETENPILRMNTDSA